MNPRTLVLVALLAGCAGEATNDAPDRVVVPSPPQTPDVDAPPTAQRLRCAGEAAVGRRYSICGTIDSDPSQPLSGSISGPFAGSHRAEGRHHVIEGATRAP